MRGGSLVDRIDIDDEDGDDVSTGKEEKGILSICPNIAAASYSAALHFYLCCVTFVV